MKEIAELARASAGASLLEIGEGVHVLERPIGEGQISVESVKKFVDEWRTAPERRAGTATILTLDSLIAFANRHKDADSVLFSNLDASIPWISAVFDYHTIAHDPRFGKHRAHYAFPLTQEWKAWRATDGKSLTQGEWAAFLEEHIAELAAPLDAEKSGYERIFQTKIATPAELITLSRGMSVTVEAKIRDFRTLASGETEIAYEEVHKDGSGAKLIVPGLFIVSVPLFVDAAPTRVLARLRYRKKDGLLAWFYQLYRADAEVREAMRQDADRVASETSMPMFEGSPEV